MLLVTEAARPCRHSVGNRWFMDETYVGVGAVWRYVYRAVDQHGQVIYVFVSKRRNILAATKFFKMMLAGLERPTDVTTDLNEERGHIGAPRPSIAQRNSDVQDAIHEA